MALCSMVGGGTNLSLCSSLLVEGTRGRGSLAIGFTSNKLGDEAYVHHCFMICECFFINLRDESECSRGKQSANA